MDLYTPSPHEELCRLFASPVPTHTMFGFDGATVTSPIELMPPEASKTGSQVEPKSVLFHTPPIDAPTYSASGAPGERAMATSAMRPLIVAGPIPRQVSPRSMAVVRDGAGGVTGALGARCAVSGRPPPTPDRRTSATNRNDGRCEGMTDSPCVIRVWISARRRWCGAWAIGPDARSATTRTTTGSAPDGPLVATARRCATHRATTAGSERVPLVRRAS